MATRRPHIDEELSALLAEDAPTREAPRATARMRLLEGVDRLERFSPHRDLIAEALGVDAQEARRALHVLSDEQGWMEIPMMPGVKIRSVWVGAGASRREADGAFFAHVLPGGAMPSHLHHGPEIMIVLQGALRDPAHPERAVWGPGDVVRSDDGSKHELMVPELPSEPCLCLVVQQGWAEYL